MESICYKREVLSNIIDHMSALRHPAYRIYKIVEREMTLIMALNYDIWACAMAQGATQIYTGKKNNVE